MPTNEFWFLAGMSLIIFSALLPFALSDKWTKK